MRISTLSITVHMHTSMGMCLGMSRQMHMNLLTRRIPRRCVRISKRRRTRSISVLIRISSSVSVSERISISVGITMT